MTRIRFEDLPSTNTPRNAENLNKLNNVVISPTEPTTGEEVWIDNSNKILYTKNDNDEYEEFYDENNLEVYSTSERRIGTWINGKPLYRKTFDASNNGVTIRIDLTNLNIEFGLLDLGSSICNLKFNAYNTTRWLPIVTTSTGNLANQIGAYFNHNFTELGVEADSSNTLNRAIVTIMYTKITD